MGSNGTRLNRVLVIDDEYACLFLAREALQEANLAQEVLTFQQAKKALAFLQEHCVDEKAAEEECPDLILLDLNMPQMDGFEFLKALEHISQSHFLQTRVVVLTSSSAERDKQRAAAYKVRGYLTKPISIEEITSLLV